MDSASASLEVARLRDGNVGQLLRMFGPFTIGTRTWNPAEDVLPFLILDPGNLDVALSFNAAFVAFWGEETARAKKQLDDKQVQYRIARDRFAVDRRKIGKVTKEALEEEWRAAAGYERWWQEQSECERAWSTANFVYDAFCKQTQNLSSLTKYYADERSSRPR